MLDGIAMSIWWFPDTIYFNRQNNRTIDLKIKMDSYLFSKALEILNRLVFWVVNRQKYIPQSKPMERMLKNLMVSWWLISTGEIVKRWGIQIVLVTSRPFSTAPQINYVWEWIMSLRNFYTVDIYNNSLVVLKRSFILKCSDDSIEFFCDCISNVAIGNVKLEKKLPSKISGISRKKTVKETHCSKAKTSSRRNRHLLACTWRLRLLKIILLSVLNHLKSYHDIKW